MPDPDPRDQLADASRAFSGVVDLLCDAGAVDEGRFEVSTPLGLYAVLAPIRDQLERVTITLQDYQPRD